MLQGAPPNPYSAPCGEPVSSAAALRAKARVRGKTIVVSLAVTLIAADLGTIILFVAMVGPHRLPAQAVRLALTVALLVFLYRGCGWARVITVLCAGAGCVVCLAGVLNGLVEANVVRAVWMGLLALFLGTVAIVILFSPSVREFLNYQYHGEMEND